jgi:hypothetical protein
MAESSAARARWELENNVQNVEDIDALFKYNAAEMQAVQQQKPWSKDPHFYKQCVPLRSYCYVHPMNATYRMHYRIGRTLCRWHGGTRGHRP